MRISSFQIHQQASQQLVQLGAQVAETQQQISSGKRVLVPSDDPMGAARLVNLAQEQSAREQFVANADAADVQLNLQESVLSQITELVQRVQELTLQAGSGVQTAEDHAFIATEIEARFDELMTLANTRNATGQYLFSGFRGRTAPFQQDGQQVVYHGDEGVRQVEIDRGQYVQINDAGSDIFMNLETGTIHPTIKEQSANLSLSGLASSDQTELAAFFPDEVHVEFTENAGQLSYTVRRTSDGRVMGGLENVPYTGSTTVSAGGMTFRLQGAAQDGDQVLLGTSNKQSLFDTVQGISVGLREIDADTDAQEFQQMIDQTIAGLESASGTLLRARTEVGARFSSLEAARDLHSDVNLQLEAVQSEIEDLDFAAAVSDLAYQSFILEAAQQSFVRINRLSLFDRL